MEIVNKIDKIMVQKHGTVITREKNNSMKNIIIDIISLNIISSWALVYEKINK